MVTDSFVDDNILTFLKNGEKSTRQVLEYLREEYDDFAPSTCRRYLVNLRAAGKIIQRLVVSDGGLMRGYWSLNNDECPKVVATTQICSFDNGNCLGKEDCEWYRQHFLHLVSKVDIKKSDVK